MTHLFEKSLLEQFKESLDLSNFRIINFPSLIFFCGGSIPKPEEEKAGLYYSLRHFVKNFIKIHNSEMFKKIVLAEEIKDWYRDGHYKDLLTFERDLAGLAAVIVIFVESPGSIAELASFAYNDQINNKLLVFLNSCHYGGESFIYLGPITYLENHIHNNAYVHTWKMYHDADSDYFDEKSLQDDDLTEIIGAINERISGIPEEQQL